MLQIDSAEDGSTSIRNAAGRAQGSPGHCLDAVATGKQGPAGANQAVAEHAERAAVGDVAEEAEGGQGAAAGARYWHGQLRRREASIGKIVIPIAKSEIEINWEQFPRIHEPCQRS